MRGLSTPVEYAFFVSLIAVNVVALVVGHGYGNE
jgi:Flp pilus assembly pilin Flp